MKKYKDNFYDLGIIESYNEKKTSDDSPLQTLLKNYASAQRAKDYRQELLQKYKKRKKAKKPHDTYFDREYAKIIVYAYFYADPEKIVKAMLNLLDEENEDEVVKKNIQRLYTLKNQISPQKISLPKEEDPPEVRITNYIQNQGLLSFSQAEIDVYRTALSEWQKKIEFENTEYSWPDLIKILQVRKHIPQKYSFLNHLVIRYNYSRAVIQRLFTVVVDETMKSFSEEDINAIAKTQKEKTAFKKMIRTLL